MECTITPRLSFQFIDLGVDLVMGKSLIEGLRILYLQQVELEVVDGIS